MNIENLSILESPCHRCYESYCYKNCNEYTRWEENVYAIRDVLEQNGLLKFLVAKEVIEDGSGYGKTCNKVQYICPNCGQIISRTICVKVGKPKHCYRCGQLLKFKGPHDEKIGD